MGKAAMCIKMLQILNSGRIYRVSELADLLETNQRNIIEYKKELEESGYYIISIPGKYGGYQLKRTITIPVLKFAEEEKKAIFEGSGYLEARNDFLLKKDFQIAMSKVYSLMKNNEPQVEPLVLNRFPLSMQNEEIVDRYKAFEICILRQFKIKLEYLSLKNEVTIRIFHPYKVFMYNNAWYAIGFDEKSREIRYFKLNRIKSFEVLAGQKYRKILAYSESDYLNEYGMKKNGEWYQIKLQLFEQYAMLIKERIYGKNQTIEIQRDGSSILTCEMQNKENIKVFVLGFGESCKVLEPEWLRIEIVDSIKKVFDRYID